MTLNDQQQQQQQCRHPSQDDIDDDDGEDNGQRNQQQQQYEEIKQEEDTTEKEFEKELHVGPMLDYTKHEFRHLFRILSTKVVLWTDMIVDTAILKAAGSASGDGGSGAASVASADDDDDDDGGSTAEGTSEEEGERTKGSDNNNKALQDLFGIDDYYEYHQTTNTTNNTNTNANKQIIQIGGNDPIMIGKAVKIILETCNSHPTYFTEINLNVDCPSCHVSEKGKFGAILMKDVTRVYDIFHAIRKEVEIVEAASSNVEISIKCRIGVDEYDDIEYISNFIHSLQPVCTRFILHARKCILNNNGISEGGTTGTSIPPVPAFTARQNRKIPPLNYPRVYELCRRFPQCQFWLNGGISTLQHAKSILVDNNGTPPTTSTTCTTDNGDIHHRRHRIHHEVPCQICNLPYGSCTAPPSSQVPPNLRGVMMGRVAIDNPCIFADVDRHFFGLPKNPCQNRQDVIDKYCTYLETVYPRRCCESDDDDDEITYGIPAPNKGKISSESEYCNICRSMYCCQEPKDKDEEGGGRRDSTTDDNDETENTENNSNTSRNTNTSTNPKPNTKKIKNIKFASRVIGRSLKPIRYLFVGLPKSRIFLTTLDRYGQDLSIRNCGPGFIIRKAVKDAISTNLLQLPFVTHKTTTEDNII